MKILSTLKKLNMKFFNRSEQEKRTKFDEVIVPAAGCVACGWNVDENLVLISSSGYSITEAKTGLLIHRDRDSNLTYEKISNNNLTFQVPLSNECISVFGFESGDGIHSTNDGWVIKVISPWWPIESVIIENVFRSNYKYLNDATMIDLNRLDGNIRSGFSPSGNKLVIMGSGGALIYSRE
ncbi:hypothetical protein [Paenibacillus endoradicis]|uniref:hypothetical protein n=1 Tax=Paenibacillus endoradicis TaxID=2972487 RepID=UPI0021596B6E|nr:hypothetical protein [Paenibacillus endoradicis]MCR8656678.1 hypothetical protein [Paenibacillus endoradicis]